MNIDDPTNRWLVHPIGRALLPTLIRWKVRPNSVSLTGLGFGFCAAMAYTEWQQPFWATVGFLLMFCWHVCDGIDGMLARATGQISDIGRLLDGICDYTTFVLVTLVISANLPAEIRHWGYVAVWAAGFCQIWQAALYEAERERFQRRLQGRPPEEWVITSQGSAMERLYTKLRFLFEPGTRQFDHLLTEAESNELLGRYVKAATPVLRLMTVLGANGRTFAIWVSCLLGRPMLFWLWEMLILSPIALLLIWRLRRIERRVGVAEEVLAA